MYAMEDAEADSAEDGFTGVQIVDDDDEYGTYYTGYWGHGPVARQMNGTLWTFDNFVTTPSSSQALWGHFSTDKGDTWSSIMIMDENDPEFAVGGYPRMVRDWCVLSNNSIIILVMLYAYDTSNNIELHMLAHWNNTDLSQWEEIDVYSSEINDVNWRRQPMIVSDADDYVMIAYERNGIHFDYYDLTTRTTINTYLKYPAVGSNYQLYLMCNASGEFFYGYGIGVTLYVYTGFETGTWDLVFSQGGSSGYYWYDCVVTADDTFVAVSCHSSGGYNSIYYWNETNDDTRYYIDAGHTDGVYAAIGLLASDPEWITLMEYHKTEDRIATFANKYYRDDSIWKSTFTVVWDETEDTIKTHVWEGSRDLHPRFWDAVEEEWIYSQLPDTGWIFNFADYDVGADDVDHWVIHRDSTTWQGIPWYSGPAPNIVTDALDDGTYGTWYEFTVTGEDGETPYIWSLLVGPGWLSIGSANGTLYGDPGGVGSFAVTVRLTETHDAPRHDDQAFTLTTNTASSGADEPISATFIFDEMGEMWMLLMVTAVFVAIARTYKMAVWRRNQR